MTRATSLAAYARAVERAWSAFVERPTLLSQRDWEAIRDWHARGIPLDVVRGAIDALSEGRQRRKPRGLAALAPAVDEEWSALEGSHGDGLKMASGIEVLPTPPVAAFDVLEDPTSPADAWRRLALEPETAEALSALVTQLLAEHAAGTEPAALDRELNTALPSVVPPELLADVEAEIDCELEAWRDRLPAADLAAARKRGTCRRLRRRLGLPALARSETSP